MLHVTNKFEVDTSSQPQTLIKNVDISAYPRINKWMENIGNIEAVHTSLRNFETELEKIKEKIDKY